MVETDAPSNVTRDVSAVLLVREPGGWRIAAQAWDMKSESKPIPSNLAAPKSS